MIINGIQCDACTKIINEKNVLLSNVLPEEWLALRKGEELLHFCSSVCLRDWALKQAPLPVEDPPHMLGTEFKVTKEDIERWRDL